MPKAITLTGLRVGGDTDVPAAGAWCVLPGQKVLEYDGATHCVSSVYRHVDGCSADGLVLAYLKGDTDPTNVYCVPQEAIDAGLATPVDHYPRLLNIGITAVVGAAVGLLATWGSKSGKIKAVGVGAGAGISLMILAATWPKSKMA